MRGLRTKLNDLSLAVACSSTQYDVIILVETWLNNDIPSDELGLSDYSVFRFDRNQRTSVYSRGGGVLIAVRKSFQCSRIHVSCDLVEQVFVRVSAAPLSVMLGAVYIPPASRPFKYSEHCASVDEVLRQFPLENILLFGDYNLPRCVWDDLSSVDTSISLPRAVSGDELSAHEYIKEICCLHNLRQINSCPNSRGDLLDIIFSNFNGVSLSLVSDHLLPLDPYHPALLADLQLSATQSTGRSVSSRFDFKNGDYPRIVEYFNTIDWDGCLNSLSTEESVTFLYNHIFHAIQSFVPVTRAYFANYPSWFSKELISRIKAKKAAHLTYKKSNDWQDYLTFCRLRSECKSLSRSCYRGYVASTEASIPLNIKTFWKFINSKRSAHGLPGSMYLGDTTSSDNSEIADMFASFFESVYLAACPNYVASAGTDSPLDLSDLSVSIGEVLDEIDNLSIYKGPGVDGIPPIFIKNCKFILSRPLWLIFNRSLIDGHFPSAWKVSNITPVHKAGAKSDISNYRPISMLNIMSKLLEAIVTRKISSLVRNALSDEQHGFLSGRSTVTNLAVFCNFVARRLDKKLQVDVIYTDFKKAFDRVDHFLLIDKLSAIGFKGQLLRWLFSYLTGRVQRVRVGEVLSRKIFATSGVPQGSHLGPLLFLLFVDDIRQIILDSEYLLFADDLKIYKCISCPSDSLSLQSDLDRLSEWCLSNRMELNISKCHILRISRCNNPSRYPYHIAGIQLSSVDGARDLGVYIDSSFSFTRHIQHVVAVSNKALGFVSRNSADFADPSTLRYLYITLVLPHLEYASVIWAPRWEKYRTQLERVQHRFLRLLAYKTGQPLARFDHNYGPVMSRANIRSLEHRRRVTDLAFLYRILNGMVDNPRVLALVNFNVPVRASRHTLLFKSQDYSSWVGHVDPLHRLSGLANRYHGDIDFFADTFSSFKSNVRKALFSDGFI